MPLKDLPANAAKALLDKWNKTRLSPELATQEGLTGVNRLRQMMHGDRLDALAKQYAEAAAGPEKEKLLAALASEDNKLIASRLGLAGAGLAGVEGAGMLAQKGVEKATPYVAGALGRPFDKRTAEEKEQDANKERHAKVRSMIEGMGLDPENGVGGSIVERFMQRPEDTDKLTAADMANVISAPLGLAGSALPARYLTKPALERLVGAQTFYHGTNPQAAESILQTGLDPTYGGSAGGAAAKIQEKGEKHHRNIQSVLEGKHGPIAAQVLQENPALAGDWWALQHAVDDRIKQDVAKNPDKYPANKSLPSLPYPDERNFYRLPKEEQNKWYHQKMIEADPSFASVSLPENPKYTYDTAYDWHDQRAIQQGYTGVTLNDAGRVVPVSPRLYNMDSQSPEMPLPGSMMRLERHLGGEHVPSSVPINATKFTENAKGRSYVGPGAYGGVLASMYAHNPDLGGESLENIMAGHYEKRIKEIGHVPKDEYDVHGGSARGALLDTYKSVVSPEKDQTRLIGGAMPYDDFHAITEHDPDDITPGQMARRTLRADELEAKGVKLPGKIGPEHLERGAVSAKNIWKNRSKNWMRYAKNNPGRVASGAGMAALGYALPAYQATQVLPTAKKIYHSIRGQTPIADAQAAQAAGAAPEVKQAAENAFRCYVK